MENREGSVKNRFLRRGGRESFSAIVNRLPMDLGQKKTPDPLSLILNAAQRLWPRAAEITLHFVVASSMMERQPEK